mmetsp:Transcript_28043/g.82456  ORF Transcript_28043/g.82456 Transcript_28043/m.82456 type:complete len:614 (-) Transcript_28043:1808-3649(-)
MLRTGFSFRNEPDLEMGGGGRSGAVVGGGSRGSSSAHSVIARSSCATDRRRDGERGKGVTVKRKRSERLRDKRASRLLEANLTALGGGGGGGTGDSLCRSSSRRATLSFWGRGATSHTATSSTIRPSFKDDDDRERLLIEKESRAHDEAHHNTLSLFFLNVMASAKVFCGHLITINAAFGVMLTVAAILCVYYLTERTGKTFHGRMDWVLLGFAVVLPLSATVRFAFARREGALRAISEFKSNALHIYMAHASWDWDREGAEGKGRMSSTGAPERWLRHADVVFEELIGVGDELFRYLTLPTSSQGRHRALRSGRREAAVTAEASYLMFDSLLAIRVSRLSRKADDLKRAGLAATEASRIRQWERYMCKSIEDMRMIKTYRTPQALRSFANLFTLLLPPFYAASYVDLAYQVNSLAVGIAFGVITSIALTALFESVQVLEDPFVAHLSLDGIDVQEELCVLHWRQLLNARRVHFPLAPPLSLSVATESHYLQDMAEEEATGKNPKKRKKRAKDALSRSEMSHDRVSAFQHDLPRHGEGRKDAMDSTFHTYLELPLGSRCQRKRCSDSGAAGDDVALDAFRMAEANESASGRCLKDRSRIEQRDSVEETATNSC